MAPWAVRDKLGTFENAGDSKPSNNGLEFDTAKPVKLSNPSKTYKVEERGERDTDTRAWNIESAPQN